MRLGFESLHGARSRNPKSSVKLTQTRCFVFLSTGWLSEEVAQPDEVFVQVNGGDGEEDGAESQVPAGQKEAGD